MPAVADPWSVDGPVLQELLLPPLAELPRHTAQDDPMPTYMAAAAQYRACVSTRAQLDSVCSVCAQYLPLVTKGKGPTLPAALDPAHRWWHEVPVADIPGKEVLVTAEHLGVDATGNPIAAHTPELPRAGLTTYSFGGVTYCLEQAGIVQHNGA